VPIIIPENWQVATSVACAAVAVVLLSLALSGVGDGFEVWSLTVPASETGDTNPYSNPFELKVTLQWGLRYLHVSYCRSHSGTQSAGSEKLFCGSDDVEYSACSIENTWCKSSPDPWPTYALMIGAIVGLVVSTVVSLSRRVYQPAGYSMCTIACTVAIVFWRMALGGFEPSETLLVWLQRSTQQVGGSATRTTGTSYWVLMAAVVVLFIGLLTASWGAIRARRDDAERDVGNVADEADVHNAPAPAVAASSNPAAPSSRPPAVRERSTMSPSRIPPPPPGSSRHNTASALEDGGEFDAIPRGSQQPQRTVAALAKKETMKIDFAEGNR
jgi:hypothetical protein